MERRRADESSGASTSGRVCLPGRGEPFVRRLGGPAGAPTVLLLHGLTGSADLNWSASYATLAGSFHVVAPDLRGHGGGIPGGSGFTLEDCADDAAALVRVIGAGPVVAVGYSMGGAIAQLLWQRHPDVVAGLVLCSTACDFRLGNAERVAALTAISAAACFRSVPPLLRMGFDAMGALITGHLDEPLQQWARGDFGPTDPATVAAAALAVSRFSSLEWIGAVDVPHAVVMTLRDRIVSPARQRELADHLPAPAVLSIDAGHGACHGTPGRFLPALLAACRSAA